MTTVLPAPFKLPKTDPGLKDILDAYKKKTAIQINCHAIATVQSFNATNQTLTATVNYQKVFYDRDASGAYTQRLSSYPILADCPVVVLGGGPASLTMPIAKGDQCLIFFNDRDIDTWITTGQAGQAPATPRLHSFSDAIALVGLHSLNKAISNYDGTRALLTNGNVSVGINPSNNKATIKNQANGTLNTLLAQLITQIENLANACAAITVTTTVASTPSTPTSGTPNNAGTISAVATALSSIATQIGGLLE